MSSIEAPASISLARSRKITTGSYVVDTWLNRPLVAAVRS